MKKSTKKKLENYPNLNRYAQHFEKTNGSSEDSGYLPYLVIWFRKLFREAGIEDDDVPSLCGFDEYEEEEFFSWGHNSRYNHVFSVWIENDIDFALSVAFSIMEEHEDCKDFDINVEKVIENEKKGIYE